MSLDSLLDVEISAASKFAQRVGESASSASVITASEIRALGYRTLAEALASVRGLSVGSDRVYAFLGIRGMASPGDYNTRVLLLIDGVRINDSLFDQAPLGSEFPLDLDAIERIEFIPGQGSAVHGANALFGVINVVTHRIAAENSADGRVMLGSGRTSGIGATLNLAGSPGRGLMLSVSTEHGDGRDLYFARFDAPNTNHGVSTGADAERSNKLLLKLDAGNGLSAMLIHADRIKGVPALGGTVFGDPANRFRDTTSVASLMLQRELDPATDWKTLLRAGEYRFEGDYAIEGTPATLNIDKALARWWGLESSVVTTRFSGHKLALGGELQWSPRRDQSNFDAGSGGTVYLDDHASSRRTSVFVEDQFEWSPRLSLTAGARHARSNSEGRTQSATSPRIAAVFKASERTVMKYIYGAAFRPPNAFESDYAVPGDPAYKGNDGLRNESVEGHEIAVEFRPDPTVRWLASAYASRARELIVQTVDPADGSVQFQNQGSLRTRGLEIEGEWLLSGGSQLRANGSLQHVDESAGPTARNAAPRRLANLIAIVPIGVGYTLGARSSFIGRRGLAAGYASTDLTLSTAQAWHGWDASFSIYNVLDRQAEDAGRNPAWMPTVPRDGRSFRMLAEYRF